MDILSTPFTKDDSGWYICGCGHSAILSKIEEHMSSDCTGYCKEGMRRYKDTQFQCICGAVFSDWDRSEKHVLDKNGKCMESALRYKSRSCSICDLDFRGTAELTRHQKTKTHKEKASGTYKDIPLDCKVCNISCLSRNLMEIHLQTAKHKARVESPPLALECNLCNIKCLSQAQMKKHLETKKHKKCITYTPI